MPEQTLSGDIRTGYDTQTAFDIKLDTFNRLSEVFNRPSESFKLADYYDPLSRVGSAQQGTATAIAPVPPMKFQEALLSNDPKINNMALDVLERSAYADPYTRLGIGKEYRTPYTREVDKFIDSKFGYDMFSDNEDFYYRNSYLDDGWFARALKNVARFTARAGVGAVTKFAEGVGYLGSMVVNGVVDGAKALGGSEVHYWQDVADNVFSKVMKNASEDFNDHVAPVYRQAGFDEKGFFSQLGNYAFWDDTVADGVAFFASAFIPAGIASKAGWLAKGVSLGTKVGEEASILARVGGAARAGLRAATGAETYGEAGLAIFNTANEAAFQATAQYTETKQQLLEEREKGLNNYTDSEIQEMSGKAAASSFGWNFPALMVSNAWEMKNILKPIMGRGKLGSLNSPRTIVTETGELGFKPYANKLYGKIAESGIGKRVRFYAPIAAKGTLMEGFWEENIQLAIDRAARGNYARYGDDTEGMRVNEKSSGGFFGILGQYAKQTIDALKGNDRENSLGIGTGALIGLAGGIGGSKFGRRTNPATGKTSFALGERKQQQLALDAVFEETNNAHNNFLSIQDTKNEDGTVNIAKLGDKVAAFESFTKKQQILNELQEKKAYSPDELESLQNELLNQYAKGLLKVGQLDNAVKRIQDLAGRNVEEKGEKFISNPVQVATYLQGLVQYYTESHSKPDHLSSKHTPSQMQEINTAIKDRAYDFRAHRKAIDPILKGYEKQVSDNLNILLTALQASPVTEAIGEGLARSRATDYVKAVAQRDVFTELAKDESSPQFMRDYHKSRVQEANDQIATYNKELGDKAPIITEDGKIEFNDDVIDFKDKSIQEYLDKYAVVFKDQALVEYSQQSYEYLADAIQHPVDGLQNWFDYRDTLIANQVKAQTPTQAAVQTYTVGEKTYATKEALDKALVDKEITQEQYDTAVKASTPPVTDEDVVEDEDTEEDTNDGTGVVTNDDPVETTEGTVVADPVEATKGETDIINPHNPLSWVTPNKKSTNDTVPLNETSKEVEQLVDVPYNEAIKAIVTLIHEDLEAANNKYKFFIVKDTFPAIYTTPADNVQAGVIPSGEVLIMKDLNNKHLTIGDVLPGKFKKLAHLPVVFSFEQSIFRNIDVPTREAIWEREKGKEPGEAAEFYAEELQKNLKARDFVRDNPTAEVQITPIHSTNGIMPTTKNVVPVIQRFGTEFIIDVKLSDSKKWKKGTILATFGKVSFPVGTTTLKSVGEELNKVDKILAKQFDTEERAKEVRNRYLNVMFYTNEKQNFGIKKVEDKWQIYFRKVDKKDNTLKPSVAHGELRFNVAANEKVGNALKNGMNIYNVDTDAFEPITAEEYQEFIKTKAVTNLKKTIDKDGNLYMKPVNAYFSFTIDTSKFQKETPKTVVENSYNKVIARIAQIVKEGTTAEKIEDVQKGLQTLLKEKKLTQPQVTKINERLTELKAELKAKSKTGAAPKATTPVVTSQPKTDTSEPIDDTKKVQQRLKQDLKVTSKIVKDIYLNGLHYLQTEDGKYYVIPDSNSPGYADVIAKEVTREEIQKPFIKVTVPQVKTETEEDEEEKRVREKKQKRKGQKEKDINETLGNVPSKSADKDYTTSVGESTYVLVQDSGAIKNKKGMISITRSSPLTPQILAEMAKNYPYIKAENGTVSGIFVTQLEGKDDKVFTAYGLPTERSNEVFVNDKGKTVTTTDEGTALDTVKASLTDNGKQQLEDFLKRNC